MSNDKITAEMLRQIMPTLSKAKRELYAPMLTACCAEFEINNERRVAAFLANLAVESMNLNRWEENLSYSAKRMTEVWPSRFPTIESARPYAKNPRALANKTYGGRMGNDHVDDGWKYRGRFPLQATGKDMYRKASVALKLPALLTDPDSLMDDYLIGFRVSAWIFAVEKGGNRLADKQQIKALTKAINGGYHGLAERTEIYQRALRVLPDDFRINGTDTALDDDPPDFLTGAETNESDDEPPIVEDKGVTSSPETKPGTSEGTPPPVPAVEITASKPSLWSRLTALSLPTIPGAVITALWTFAKSIPTSGWIALGMIFTVGMILGAWIYNESMKRAAERTRMASTAASDQTKNNIRYV